MKIAWLGPVFSEADMLAGKAISPAGNRWQTGLLTGLAEIGHRASVTGFRPEPAFPSGALWVPSSTPALPFADVTLSSYLNLPFVRNVHQWWILRKGVFKTHLAGKAVVLSYNAPPAVRRVGLSLKAQGIPWVPIIADVPSSKIDAADHDDAVARASGVVYLSHHLFASSNQIKLHLDGGVCELPSSEEKPFERAILYTGMLTDYTGAFDLLSEFRHVNRADIELWVCGKGDIERARKLAAHDTRIKIFGTVSETRLRDLSEKALAFVNPRRPDDPFNATNFPSKLLEYLSYGKPVISSWTPGLAPVYRNLLTVYEKQSDLPTAIKDVITWSAASRQSYRENVRQFLSTERTWVKQAQRLMHWIQSEILSPKA